METIINDKLCKICGLLLSVDEFYKNKQYGKQGQKWDCFDSYCKKCRIVYCNTRKQDIKKQAVEYLGGKCVDCGLITNKLCVYDFHHREPNKKDFSIGYNTKSFNRIKPELDKCDLLCANCHRYRHNTYKEQTLQ